MLYLLFIKEGVTHMKNNERIMMMMVGGRSGVGKTTLINTLIKLMPEIYKRPVSYTSRKKRDNENNGEYVFCDENTIISLYNEGAFLTLDNVYGNYYAMTRESIDHLISNNIIPIKEIHPSNHKKIKACYSICLSVLVKSLNKVQSTDLRKQEDESFYSGIDDNEFDVIFMYNTDQSEEQNAKDFHLKITCVLRYFDSFPLSSEVDILNKAGYTKVAKYFDDTKRVTTKNFHDLSLEFFSNVMSNIIKENMRVLEVGPGRGWLRKCFTWNDGITYNYVEISDQMLIDCTEPIKNILSVRCMPFHSGSFDCVVSSLADPYFYPEALCEINRVLSKDGIFVFSIPSKEWAGHLRTDDLQRTTFILDDGDTAQVFSFALNKDYICGLMKDCGFEMLNINSEFGIKLRGRPISPAITQSAMAAGTCVDDLEIIITGIFRKLA